MSKPQKIFTVSLWVVAVLSMVVFLMLYNRSRSEANQNVTPTEPQVMYAAPEFSLTDQNNKTFSSKQLAGHPWVADFVFTTCTSSCPRMTQHMSELQKQVPAEVKLISFSVDPDHDTPAMMAEYLDSFHAEPGRWMMLTGDKKTQVKVVTAMKLHFAPASEGQDIVHDSHFVLVDAQGQIRGYYESDDVDAVAHLKRDITWLLAHPNDTAK